MRTGPVKNIVVVAVAWLLLTASMLCAESNLTCAALADRFHKAYTAWSNESFKAVADAADQALAEASCNPVDALYWKGVALFHRSLQRLGSQEHDEVGKDVKPWLEEAEQTFKALLEQDPEHGEAHALLANVIGLRIAGAPWTAMFRGGAVNRHKKLALEYASQDPRVYYLIGSSYYHAPALLKRNDLGLEYFLTSEKLYRAEQEQPPAPDQPRWGYPNCLAFIGAIYEHRDNVEKARAYYRKTLEQNPEHLMALEGLERLAEEKKEAQDEQPE